MLAQSLSITEIGKKDREPDFWPTHWGPPELTTRATTERKSKSFLGADVTVSYPLWIGTEEDL